MAKKAFDVLQKIGKCFMLPIALLPIAGLFLGIGASFTSETFVQTYHLENVLSKGHLLYNILYIFKTCGETIFGNLALLFAIAVALGMAKAEKAIAALSAVTAYLVMYTALTSSIDLFGNLNELKEINGLISNVLGFQNTMNTGVFGGIIVGLVVSYLHNRFYKIELPDFLSFFGGTRFVPIICTFVAVPLGILFFFIWPYCGMAIANLGELVAKAGYFGTFAYGYIYRALIPLGLHHVFYIPFWQTSLGGVAEVCGASVEGAQNIVFAQIACGDKISPEYAKFFSGLFPFMIFGFPAAAFAMYQTAKKNKQKQVKGLLVSASLTSIFTGITEPIEFSFLFVSPFLYFGVHCVLAAFSFALMHFLQVGVGTAVSGGLIDLILYGVIPGDARTNWIPIVLVGIAYAVVYYLVFRFFILKFNLKTPGREDDDEETKLYTKADYVKSTQAGETQTNTNETNADPLSAKIVTGLGGEENLVEFGACATRLRVTVKDGSKVDKDLLKNTGAFAVLVKDNAVQVVYGPRVSIIKTNVDEYLGQH